MGKVFALEPIDALIAERFDQGQIEQFVKLFRCLRLTPDAVPAFLTDCGKPLIIVGCSHGVGAHTD
jgi:hypothetical protein